jgi:hypothetical protein
MAYTARLGIEDSQPGNVELGQFAPILLTAITTIELNQQVSKWSCDYLTPFDKVIPLLGLSDDSQGTNALIHALLQCAGFYSPRNGSSNGNPFHESLHRLEQFKVNPHALKILREFFNAAAEQYDRK